MDRRRSLASVIGRHCEPFRKSQRTTMAALCGGLPAGRGAGLLAAGSGADRTGHGRRCQDDAQDQAGGPLRGQRPDLGSDGATLCLVKWLAYVSRRTATVALDCTDISGGRVMLSAAVAVAHRAVPVAWTVMGKGQFTKKRKSPHDAQEQMIRRLQEAFGEHPRVLVADRRFARAELLARLPGAQLERLASRPGTAAPLRHTPGPRALASHLCSGGPMKLGTSQTLDRLTRGE